MKAQLRTGQLLCVVAADVVLEILDVRDQVRARHLENMIVPRVRNLSWY